MGFFKSSYGALLRLIENNNNCCITSNCITDIYYIIRKLSDRNSALKSNFLLTGLCDVLEVGESDVLMALNSKINDYEDAIVEAVAYKNNCDYILTCDEKHYKNSKVNIITPKEINIKISFNL